MAVTVSDEIHARDMAGIRFGVTVAPEASADRWKDKVRAIEDSPFDVLLVNDHLSGFRFAPMLALSAAAEITTRLRLGTIVLANDYRHPALLAKEAATLDLLSDGRLELGLGRGGCVRTTTRPAFRSTLRRSALPGSAKPSTFCVEPGVENRSPIRGSTSRSPTSTLTPDRYRNRTHPYTWAAEVR